MDLHFWLRQETRGSTAPGTSVRKLSVRTPRGWEGLEPEGMSGHDPSVLNHRCRDGLQVLEVLPRPAGAQLLDVSRDPPVGLEEDGSIENRYPLPLATGASYLPAPGVTQELLVLGRGGALGQGT